MKIAFLGVRVPGHLNPMTTLARRLKARGHDVVFISVLDTEPYVRAAQLPFIPYCEKEFPLGSVRPKTDQLGKLEGQAALEFAIRSVANGLESAFRNLPQTLREANVDALVLDQVNYGLGLVPMHLGMPYVHVSNALHFDYSGNTPFAVFDWPHETTPEALVRNKAGLAGFMRSYEPATSVAHFYAKQVGLNIDWSDPSRYHVRIGMAYASSQGVRFPKLSLASAVPLHRSVSRRTGPDRVGFSVGSPDR